MAKLKYRGGKTMTGRVVTAHSPTTDQLPYAGAPKNSPFWLMARHTSWVFRDGRFIPKLSRFALKSGLRNITRDRRTGALGTDVAVAGMTRKKWVILRNGDDQLGEDADYLRVYTNTKGEKHYASKWQIPRIVGDQTVWGTDEDAQDAAYARWVDAGIVPALDPSVAEGMILQAETRVSHLESLLQANPGNAIVQARHVVASKRLDAMRAEYDRLFTQADAPPPKARKVKAGVAPIVFAEEPDPT